MASGLIVVESVVRGLQWGELSYNSTYVSGEIGVPGAQVGDAVMVTPIGNTLRWFLSQDRGFVSSAGNVQVRLSYDGPDNGPVDAGIIESNIMVVRGSVVRSLQWGELSYNSTYVSGEIGVPGAQVGDAVIVTPIGDTLPWFLSQNRGFVSSAGNVQVRLSYDGPNNGPVDAGIIESNIIIVGS